MVMKLVTNVYPFCTNAVEIRVQSLFLTDGSTGRQGRREKRRTTYCLADRQQEKETDRQTEVGNPNSHRERERERLARTIRMDQR